MRTVLAAIALVAALFAVRPGAAADASLTVIPPSQSVNEGTTFTVTISQNAADPTIGTQADLTFDPDLVQVVTVEPGPAWTGASFLMGVAPQTKAEAIAEGNATGILQNIALIFLVPGSGSVPAGENTFVTVGMQARPAVGGTSPLILSDASMFDSANILLSVSLTCGEVTVVGPTPTETPVPCNQVTTPTATPTVPPTPTPTRPPTPTPPLEAFLSVSPSSITVPPGAEFSITITQNANRTTTGAQTDMSFDPAILEIIDVTRGRPYQAGTLVMGVVPPEPATPVPKPATIAEANVTGILKNAAVFLVPGAGDPVPAGEAVAVNIKLKGKADGRSPITLSNMEMIDDQGKSVGVGANNGEIVVLTGAPLPGTLGASRLPSGGGTTAGGGPLAGALVVMGLIAAGAGTAVLLRRLRTTSK